MFYSFILWHFFLTTAQFPMSQYVKDPSHPAGWRTVSHAQDKYKDGIDPDVANLNPDAMDEVFDEISDIEPDTE